MTDRGGGEIRAAGGPIRHVPVLREEALAALAVHAGGLYLDGTFGAGGYTRALLMTPGTRVLALDRDPAAVAAGRDAGDEGGRLVLREARFGTLAAVAEAEGFVPLDGVVLDIGVSSMQIDEAERGFSFRQDGPLDMRMGGTGPTAADLLASLGEAEIADILYTYGEERASRRIARAIVTDRARLPFTRTRQLAELIARLLPGPPGEIHPATRTFQALRIAVNDELGELERALAGAERVLKPGGRLAIVTFHSLEDRIVKRFFQERSGRAETVSRHMPQPGAPPPATFRLDRNQPVVPGADEIAANPRARSAKLRFGIRTDAPARPVPRGPEAGGFTPAAARPPRRRR